MQKEKSPDMPSFKTMLAQLPDLWVKNHSDSLALAELQ